MLIRICKFAHVFKNFDLLTTTFIESIQVVQKGKKNKQIRLGLDLVIQQKFKILNISCDFLLNNGVFKE